MRHKKLLVALILIIALLIISVLPIFNRKGSFCVDFVDKPGICTEEYFKTSLVEMVFDN